MAAALAHGEGVYRIDVGSLPNHPLQDVMEITKPILAKGKMCIALTFAVVK